MLVVAALFAGGGAEAVWANERLNKVLPYCTVVLEPVGKTLAEVAAASPHPLLKGAGYVFKGTELSLELGTAAVEAHETWLETEIVVVDEQAKRLKQIHAAHGDLNGPEATRIKTLLRSKQIALGGQREDALAYTLDALIQHWGYVTTRMAVDKGISKSLGFLLKHSGMSTLIDRVTKRPPKLANRLFNYGGALDEQAARWDWKKLGKRGKLAEEAMANAMIDMEAKLVAAELKVGRGKALDELAKSAFGWAYAEALRNNPSRQAVVPSDFRLVAARAAEIAIETALPVAAPAPLPANVPPIRFDPRNAPVALVTAIENDDTLIDYYEAPSRSSGVNVPYEPTPEPEPEPEPEPQPVPQVSESSLRFHEALKLVGDGKTFTVCSNGCPATSDWTWDGRRDEKSP